VEVRTAEAKGFETTVRLEEGKKAHVRAEMQKLLPEEVRRQRAEEMQARILALEKNREMIWQKKVAEFAPSRSRYHWAGSLLIVGGAAALATGIGIWAKPMQDAMDRRDGYRQDWFTASTEQEALSLEQKAKSADDDAKRYNIVGWVGLGVGVAALAGGIVTLVLTPGLPDEKEFKKKIILAGIEPILGPDGGGVSLSWSW